MTNSRQKGKRGEREAAAYLKSLGFEAARSQQYNGKGDADIVSPDLPKLHIEVKYGYPVREFNVGTVALQDACQQAREESGDKHWVVLWRNKGYKQWRLTWPIIAPPRNYAITELGEWETEVTCATDREIQITLQWMGAL